MTKRAINPLRGGYEDKRVEKRVAVFKAAKIIHPETGVATDCAVLDFTSQGAKLRLIENFDVPLHFDLVFVAGKTLLKVEKVWQQDVNAGVRFISPPKKLDEEVVIDG